MDEPSPSTKQELTNTFAAMLLGMQITSTLELSKHCVYLESLPQRDLWEGYADGIEGQTRNGTTHLYLAGFKHGSKDAGSQECVLGYGDGVGGFPPRHVTRQYIRCYVIGRKLRAQK